MSRMKQEFLVAHLDAIVEYQANMNAMPTSPPPFNLVYKKGTWARGEAHLAIVTFRKVHLG